jgi:hypothetical protein
MGGPGSGRRWRLGAKSTTDDFLAVDVRYLARNGGLRPGYCGALQWTRNGETVASIGVLAEHERLTLKYRHQRSGEDCKDEQYPVRIARTPCHLGGSRLWFICPAAGCGRRVAILYGGATFACRHCYHLAYRSSRVDAGARAIRRADRLRARLGWVAGIVNGVGRKPRWMRWKTFARLAAKHQALAGRYWQQAALRLAPIKIHSAEAK